MDNKIGQEIAFPNSNGNNGMSKRFYAACAAMQGILSNQSTLPNAEWFEYIGKYAWIAADELLKQENR